jgi:Fic family protein
MEEQPIRLDPRLHERLIHKKRQLDQYRPFSPGVVQQLYEQLRVFLTYHSNAIEGNTLSLRETQLVVEYGLTAGGHTLREYTEATNHARAFTELTQLADATTPITTETILRLHQLVMQQLLPTAGRFRTIPVFIRGVDLRPPPPTEVPQLMAQWAHWVNEGGHAYPPVVRAAIAHHEFEAVHPFEDGNGRVGRLLLNLMLMRDGYPPALLLRDWRLAYLQALTAGNQGRYAPVANIVGRAVEGGLDLYLEACNSAPDAAYLPLSQLAKDTPYTTNYLGWLVRQGRLAAVKRGGRWYSTRDALARYRAEVAAGRVPPGRPRGDTTTA